MSQAALGSGKSGSRGHSTSTMLLDRVIQHSPAPTLSTRAFLFKLLRMFQPGTPVIFNRLSSAW